MSIDILTKNLNDVKNQNTFKNLNKNKNTR